MNSLCRGYYGNFTLALDPDRLERHGAIAYLVRGGEAVRVDSVLTVSYGQIWRRRDRLYIAAGARTEFLFCREVIRVLGENGVQLWPEEQDKRRGRPPTVIYTGAYTFSFKSEAPFGIMYAVACQFPEVATLKRLGMNQGTFSVVEGTVARDGKCFTFSYASGRTFTLRTVGLDWIQDKDGRVLWTKQMG